MKKIEAFIQPFMLKKTEIALRNIHVHGMTVSDVRGFGKEKDESYPHHEADYLNDFTPKTKIEIFCNDSDEQSISGVIRDNAYTGRKGDGKIFVYNIEKAMSIRTGETDKNVL